MNEAMGAGRAAAAAAALACALLGGCAAKVNAPAAATSEAAAPAEGWAGRESVTEAIALLNQGKADEARARLAAVLKRQPSDMIARRLLDQIDQEPKALLGEQHFVYTAKEGDSFSALAGKYLGDPMMFYALARYNGLAAPTAPAPGQKLLIPGKEPAAAVAKKAAPPRAEPKKPAASAANSAPAQPAAPAADPARATKLRGMALAAMNGGAIDKAVSLLRQAHAANPADGRIKADLDRAVRIQATVQRK